MKRSLLLVAAALALMSARSRADTVTIVLEGAQLLTSGSTPIPDGSLIQLLADDSTTFGLPTPTSFEGTDPNEVLLDSFAMDSATVGVAGDFKESITLTLETSPTEPFVGADLLLRWYPTLTTSSAAPGEDTPFGQFRTDAVENSSDIAWVVPSSGNYNLNFITMSQSPSSPEPNSAGVASMTVGAVPEPSSFTMVAGAVAIGAAALRRRRG